MFPLNIHPEPGIEVGKKHGSSPGNSSLSHDNNPAVWCLCHNSLLMCVKMVSGIASIFSINSLIASTITAFSVDNAYAYLIAKMTRLY